MKPRLRCPFIVGGDAYTKAHLKKMQMVSMAAVKERSVRICKRWSRSSKQRPTHEGQRQNGQPGKGGKDPRMGVIQTKFSVPGREQVKFENLTVSRIVGGKIY